MNISIIRCNSGFYAVMVDNSVFWGAGSSVAACLDFIRAWFPRFDLSRVVVAV